MVFTGTRAQLPLSENQITNAMQNYTLSNHLPWTGTHVVVISQTTPVPPSTTHHALYHFAQLHFTDMKTQFPPRSGYKNNMTLQVSNKIILSVIKELKQMV